MIIAAVLLCCFLLFKEWKRENRGRLLLRMLAVVLLVASLLFLIVPLSYESAKTTNSKKLLLLTKGFANKLSKNESYYTQDSTVLEELGSNRVKYLPDLNYYLRLHPEVSGLQVFGHGLSSDELKSLPEISYAFEGSPNPGIQSVSWPDELPSSAALNVQGVYENKADAPVQLLLEGAGSKLDSVTIAANQKSGFSLSSRPKQSGKAIYHLIVMQGTKELANEKIPFNITESPKVKVMVLASSPDFEFKFLRNWLFENKYPAYFRTRISKDKFSTDQLNSAGKQAEDFNPSMFKNFDLLVADDEELAQLSPAAKANLNTAISSGMGLLVRINEGKPVSSFAKAFRIKDAADSITTSIVPVLSGEGNKLKAIPVSQPLFVEPDPGKLSLVENTKGNILLSSRLYGAGTLAASTVASTYNWLLSGATADYARYWSHVINKTARKVEKKLSWQVKPQFPVSDEPVSIGFQTKSDKALPEFTVNQTNQTLQQHPMLPFYWQGSARLDHTGWNAFKIDDQPADAFFVYKPGDWSSVKTSETMAENQEFARNSSNRTETQVNRTEMKTQQLSKWWFFALFLISISFLWFETKLLQ
jgi:hypothetical protein